MTKSAREIAADIRSHTRRMVATAMIAGFLLGTGFSVFIRLGGC